MAWTCKSMLLPTVTLSTIAAEVFSIQMNLPPDVEAEIDYFGTPPTDFRRYSATRYRECFIPTEGHFPLLSEELLRTSNLSGPDQKNFAHLLQRELSQLREDGVLGNVVLLRQTIRVFIKEKLDSGEFSQPMEIAFLPPDSARRSHP